MYHALVVFQQSSVIECRDGRPEDHGFYPPSFSSFTFHYKKGDILVFIEKTLNVAKARIYADKKARRLKLGTSIT